MKKTKLFTSLAAFVLVLSLGACSEPEQEDVSSEDNEPTSSETTTEENTSETTTEENTSGGEGEEEDPIDAILSSIEEETNYTTFIEYKVYESDYYYSGSDTSDLELELSSDYCVEAFYTEDAVLMYSFYNYYYALLGYVMYVELYVNIPNGGGVYHYTLDENAQYVNELVLTDTITSVSYGPYEYPITCYQDYLYTLADFTAYKGTGYVLYSESETDYGTMLQYQMTQSGAYALLEALFMSNYIEDNMLTTYYIDYYNLISSYYCVYYADYEEWDVYFGTPEVEYSYSGISWLEQDNLYASVTDVGTTSIPSGFESFLNTTEA